MLTIQTNIALQIVSTLTQEELADFCREFDKLQKPVANCKPKKVPRYDPMQIFRELQMEKHTKRIPAQGKLA